MPQSHRHPPDSRPLPARRAPARVAACLAVVVAAYTMPPPAPAQDTAAVATDLYEQGLARFRAHDYEGAVVALKSELQREPGSLPALLLLGKVLLAVGDGAGAEDALSRARRRGADDSLVVEPLARALLAQRAYRRLLDELDPVGQPESLQAVVLALQGEALLALDEPEQARQHLQRAVEIAPASAAPRIGLARLALASGHPEIALEHGARALAVEPDSTEAWFVDADARRLDGDLAGAADSYGRVLDLNPRHERARIARAATLVDLGRTAEALRDIETVQARNPEQPQAAYLQALILSREGRLDDADAILSKTAAAIEDVDARALRGSAPMLLLAGAVANARGNAEQASRHLQRFLALEPGHALARRMLGAILVRQGEARRAIDVLQPALAQAPSDPQLHATLGVAYRMIGQAERSVDALSEAVRLAPQREGLRVELARTRIAAGQTLTAARELEALAAPGGEHAAEAGVLLARLRVESGDVEGALGAARAAVDAAPRSARAHVALGDTLALTRDGAGAERSYAEALALEPGSVPAELGLAGAAMLQGRVAEAAQRYEALVEHEEGAVAARIGLARVSVAERRLDDAVRWLERARDLAPDAVGPQLELVDVHLARGANADALRAASRVEGVAPDDVRVVVALGRAQAASGDRAAAKASFRRAAQLPGAAVRQLVALSARQLALGDVQGARETLQAADARDPDHLPTQAALVALDVYQKHPADALERARAVHRRHPQRALGAALVGDALAAGGDFAGAAAAYGDAIALEPVPGFRVKRFRALWQGGRADEAIAGLEAWLADEPDQPLARRTLAGAYLSSGRFDEALQLHEALLQARPDDADLLNNLAWLYQQQGDPRSLETARRAYEAAPGRTDVLDTYGWVLLESGEPAQALRILREAQVRDPDNPWVRYHTALALTRMDRADEARELLSALLASGVPFPKIEEARALLTRLGGG